MDLKSVHRVVEQHIASRGQTLPVRIQAMTSVRALPLASMSIALPSNSVDIFTRDFNNTMILAVRDSVQAPRDDDPSGYPGGLSVCARGS